MEQTEQPISWPRAFMSGWAASTLMMAFVDIFYMLGVTRFSFEAYLGSLIFDSSTGAHLWTAGLLANWILGAVFGVIYGFYFENIFRASGARPGAILGAAHVLLAALAIFPFFQAIREYMGVALYGDFGMLGSGMSAATPVLIIFAHIIFGTTVGTFYGPVGRERVRARIFAPGEVLPGIHAREDEEERQRAA